MLIEQAFMALPEFLVGAPYEIYEHEGTLVMAFSMSLLQELNGRNINNPISVIRGEAAYETGSAKRADLHLRLDSLGIRTDGLRQYGYRDQAWLEAKFCRRHRSGAKQGKQKITGTDAVTEILADVIRLSCLPPETMNSPSSHGRYLLHAYQGCAEDFLPLGEDGANRVWARAMLKSGRAGPVAIDTMVEKKTFDRKVGAGVRGLHLWVGVTNFVHSTHPATNDTYRLVLTRVDSVSARYVAGGGLGPPETFELSEQVCQEAPVGAFKRIRKIVLDHLK